MKMLIECFRDHWAFKDIEQPNTLTYDLMFDDMFMIESEDDNEYYEEVQDRQVYIPYLMLLGNLYCCSNKTQKADKYYELVEIELTDQLLVSDKEF